MQKRDPVEEAVIAAKEEAILSYISARAIPVLADIGEDYVVEGTATLFRHGDRRFLVGADHVLKVLATRRADLGIPADPSLGIVLRRLTGFLVRPAKEWADTSVFELHDERVKTTLDQGWAGTTVEDFARFRQSYTAYLLAGYPSKLARREGGVVSAQACLIYSESYEGPLHYEAEPSDPNIDILMAYPTAGVLEELSRGDIPPLNGVSGCAIWTIQPAAATGSVWEPSSEVKLTGIQSGAAPGGYMRGKQAQLLIAAFELIDPAIASDLRSVIHPS